MKHLSTGVDILELERFQQAIDRHGDRILQRVFTTMELSQVGENLASLAARFAAKEAVAKALCTGIGPVTWQEIEVLRGPDREPVLHLHGAAQTRATALGLHIWSLSLSHSANAVVAFVVAMG
jgi:holo-[acyl-carrier protein] synthase